MKVRKAVILAAGLGTRMLPASKVVPKELLPVVDTPAIQIVAQEAARSGIEDIIIVVSPGKGMLLDHFAPHPELEQALEEREKHDLLELVRECCRIGRISAVEQHPPRGLGHAVLCARDAVGNEPFAVMLPDDIFDAERPALHQLLNIAENRNSAAIMLMRVGREDVSKYGITEGEAVEQKVHRVRGLVEKPPPDKAPSDLAIMGRYVLTPEIFDFLEHTRPGVGGEIQLTDALQAYARERELYGFEFTGKRYDLGDRVGFVMAQVAYALKRPELADKLRPWLKSVVG